MKRYRVCFAKKGVSDMFKRRKEEVFSLFLVFIMLMTLSACSEKYESVEFLDKVGIAPYDLSEEGEYLLQAFGMENTSQIIAFKAPKEAITMNVNVYCLDNSEQWNPVGESAISIGEDREPVEQLEGTFAMQLQKNYGIDFHINCAGRMSSQSEEIVLDNEGLASVKVFLQEFEEVELNTEVPVALMVYDSGTSMKSYSLQDYFNPSEFAEMDIVQAVTLEFSDKGL